MPEAKKLKLKKLITVANVQNQDVNRIPFKDEWHQAFGNPQDTGVWFIWGGSGSGKSTFMMMLSKILATNYDTLYNLLEEEVSDTDYIDRTIRLMMSDVKETFHTAAYNFEELCQYILKKGSKKTIFIDSLRYLTRSFEEYLYLKKLALSKQKLLICSGFAKGGDPRSEFEYQVMHDAKMKIFVEGYAAYCKGRTIGPNGGLFIIYKEGYEKLHGENATKSLSL